MGGVGHLVEVQGAIPLVEDARDVGWVEEKAILLPAEFDERRVGGDLTVEDPRTTECQVHLLLCMYHPCLVCNTQRAGCSPSKSYLPSLSFHKTFIFLLPSPLLQLEA